MTEEINEGYPYNEAWFDDWLKVPKKIKQLLADIRAAGVPSDEAAERAAISAIIELIECSGRARVADLLTELAVSLRRLDPEEWESVSVEERRGSFRIIEAKQ